MPARQHRESEPLLLPSATAQQRHHAKQRLLHRGVTTSIRHDIWTVLRYRSSITNRSGLQVASYILELCILTLVLLNVVLAISESSSLLAPATVPTEQSEWYATFLFVSTIIFSVEYALRFWSCVEDDRYDSAILGRLKWMTQPMSVIDLLALIPFYMEIFFEFMVIPSYPAALTLRSLRLLRILSFLRLERSYSAMANMKRIFTTKKEELLVVSYLTAVIVLTSSTTIFFLENAAQPSVFSSVAVSAWWSVETITSLGYGDMVPQTTAGRLFGAVLALWGIILFTIPGAILGSAFIEVMLEQQRREEDDELSVILRGSWETMTTTAGGGAGGGGGGGEAREDGSGQTNGRNGKSEGRHRHLLPTDAEYSPASHSHSFARMSPRVLNLLKMDGMAQKIDDLVVTQAQLQHELADQRAQISEIKRLLDVLVARSE